MLNMTRYNTIMQDLLQTKLYVACKLVVGGNIDNKIVGTYHLTDHRNLGS